MSVQVWLRAVAMAAASTVIVLTGGHALLAGLRGDAQAAAVPGVVRTSTHRMVAPRPSAASSADPDRPAAGTGSAAGTEFSSAGTLGTTSVPESGPAEPAAPMVTTLSLVRVKGATAAGVPHAVLLRGTVLAGQGRVPVAGRVTLWRKGRGGHWTAVLADRVTSADGTVRLVVSQAASSMVYRLTFPASPRYRAATSANLTVTRG